MQVGDNSETIIANNQMIDPEEAQTFEIGTKWDFLDNHLNLTAAIFRTENKIHVYKSTQLLMQM